MNFSSHESYFAATPAPARERLLLIQAEVERALPGLQRCISYRMPAFRWAQGRRPFFYFAAFKKHVGIYPPLHADAALVAETAPYRGPKGNLSFAHDQALPLDLIVRVAQALARQYGPA